MSDASLLPPRSDQAHEQGHLPADASNPPIGRQLANLARRHAAGIAIAILLTLSIVGPRWWLLTTEPSQGDRVQLSPWGAGAFAYDQTLYLPNIRDSYDGRLTLGAPYAAGDPDTPAQTGAYWLQAIGLLGRATGSIFSALALAVTLTLLIAFLALYALGVEVSGSRWGSIAFMLCAMFFTYVVTLTAGLLALRRWAILAPIVTLDPNLTFHPWARFIAPIIPLPALFICVIAIPRAVQSGQRKWMAISAIALALLVYSYLFYWTAFAAALACWLVWLVYRRDFPAVRRLAIIGILAVIIALPELIGLAHNSLSFNDDIRARLGTGVSSPLDRPNVSTLAQRFLIGLPFLVVLLRGPDRNRLYMAMYVTPLVLSRAAVIFPQPGHYIDFVYPAFTLPAFIAGGAEIFRMIDRTWQRAAMAALTAGAVAAAVWLVAFQIRVTRDVDPAFSMRSDEHAAFDWMADNVDDGETVVSPSISTNLYVAALTPATRYILEGFIADPTDDEIMERYLRVQVAFGFSEAETFDRLDPYDTCHPGQTTICEDAATNFPFRGVIDDLGAREADLERSMSYYLLNWQIIQPTRILDRFRMDPRS